MDEPERKTAAPAPPRAAPLGRPGARPPGLRSHVTRLGCRLITGPLWAPFLRALDDPRAATERKLLQILRRNRETDFGREHGFASIRTLEDYQRAVPPRSYDGIEPYLARMCDGAENVLVAEKVEYFAQSSGTTGTPKMIPLTRSYIREFQHGRWLFVRPMVLEFPWISYGEEVGVTSPKIVGRTKAGVPFGSITGKLSMDKPAWQRRGDLVPLGVYLVEDFNWKYYLVLRIALERRISRIHTPNPSTVVLICKKLNELAERLIDDLEAGRVEGIERLDPDTQAEIRRRVKGPNRAMAEKLRRLRREVGWLRPIDVWDDFALVICWKGGSAPFYLKQFPRYFGSTPVFEMGFAATEGSFSVPLTASRDDGVLAVNVLAMEFVPEEERGQGDSARAVDPSRLEVGGRYFILVTSSAGLYRYDINDLVECTGFFRKTPLVRFLHKGGNMVSITGEKIGESHVVQAMRRVSEIQGIDPAGFTVTVDLSGEVPRYVFAIEGAGTESEEGLRGLLAECDRQLKLANLEYEAKRDSLRLAEPRLAVVAPGGYERFRKMRLEQGAPDAHVKMPHLSPDARILDRFEIVREIGGTAPDMAASGR